MKVAQLFCQHSRDWDREKVRNLFSVRDADAILSMRIPYSNTADRMAWVHSKDGQYTVKSGYRLWQEGNRQQPPNGSSYGWKKIWELQIPPKVKFFLWRFCRNNIPVRAMLQRRCTAVPLICPMCNTDVEHILHVFFDCTFASQCWQHMGLTFNMREVDDAAAWLLNKLASENHDQLNKIAMTLWALWFFRNKKVWEDKRVTPRFAIEWSLKQLHDWKKAVSQTQTPQQNRVPVSSKEKVRWARPAQGNLKINVDAGIVQGSSCFTIGMLLRDHSGFFLEGQTMKLNRTATVMEAEAAGIEEAMRWAASKGLSNVCFESDSLMAVQAINGSTVFHSDVGHSIDFCRSKLAVRSDFCVCHVRRLANRAAHCMARIPCELNSFVSVMNPPRNVLDSVMFDACFE